MFRYIILIFCVLLKVTPAFAQIPPMNENKIRVLLITGRGDFAADDPYRGWVHGFFPDALRTALGADMEVTVAHDTSLLTDQALGSVDVVINNSLFMRPTKEQFDALFRFVDGGGGFMALHVGLLSFLNDPRYEEMIGERFINHDAIKGFQVDVYDNWYGWAAAGSPRHPITEGMPNFGVVDELYMEQMNTFDLIMVARAELHPVMWVREHGAGRVVCLTLGHDELAINTRGFHQLFSNGVRWAAKRKMHSFPGFVE
jgi:type 1 glutamine amidotransferase